MKTVYIIKVGGNVIDEPVVLDKFLSDFSKLNGLKILVHGGGKIATELSKTLGIIPQMLNGRRITDAETLKVVTMVYAGLINKNIVAKLQALKCNAIGLTGADANTIPATKRSVEETDYGFVGDIDNFNLAIQSLKLFLDNRMVPVFSAITHDGVGSLLNTNADTIASALATALSKEYETVLLYCFEKKGVLKDVNDNNSVITKISGSDYDRLKQTGIIYQGMIPKLDNAFTAIDNGVKAVYICHADDIISIINKGEQKGTCLIKEK
ncbi:MAG TPA: acetylglutamate kinase [Bacteroidia bacterium]|nr:acetylglutamate kinase [Bacteroidia bacterium]